MEKRKNKLALKFYPVTSSSWPDIEELFGERGACGGCWCMYWRLPRKEWTAGKGQKNKRAFEQIVCSGDRPGIIAYSGREPIGWCAVAPRDEYPSLVRSRVSKPLDDTPVWSITCLFVKKPYRRQGVSIQLIKEAVKFARRHGALMVEGYPIEPTMQKTPDPFVFLGVPSAFIAAGFKEVVRRSKSRPIMRIETKRRNSPPANESKSKI